MTMETVLSDLLRLGENDWIPPWVIAQDVVEGLEPEDSSKSLQLTLVVVAELLKRGFVAGDSPVQGDGVHFAIWPRQEPGFISDFIRAEWTRRGGFPSWSDRPWCAHPQYCDPRHGKA